MSDEEKIDKQSTDNASLSTETDNNVSERSTINEQPSTNMEVHKHPQHITHKKKWGEYFLEFFMLFLAVFLGFLAENIRENSVERHREKEYMKSLYDDVAKDQTQLQRDIENEYSRISEIDSLILLLNKPDPNNWANDITYFSRGPARSTPFTINDRTVVQLRNAGGMRLITNKKVSDSIVGYYKTFQGIEYLDNLRTSVKERASAVLPKIVDANDYAKVFDPINNKIIRSTEKLRLRPKDDEAINEYIFILQNMKAITISLRNIKKRMIQKAKAIQEVIKKEYHIE